MAYGLGLVLLLLSLGISTDRRSAGGLLGAGLYAAGMLGFVGGILLEIYGFYCRVAISGWAPVTNMYETVVWVALIAAVLGLIFELITRKTYPALAASGVALLATVLAANVSLLDPTIGSLMPVLRSNYWLTIHVLTIVSSYAAFALTLGLGLLAIGFYLTATYRGLDHLRAVTDPARPGLAAPGAGNAGRVWLVPGLASRRTGYRSRLLRDGGRRRHGGHAVDRGHLRGDRRAGEPATCPCGDPRRMRSNPRHGGRGAGMAASRTGRSWLCIRSSSPRGLWPWRGSPGSCSACSAS